MKNTDKLFAMSNVDAIILTSEKNRFYFTEFASTFGCLALFPNNKATFITDPRYYEMAQCLECENTEVLQIANGSSALKVVNDLFAERSVKTVGFEDTEMTVAEYSDFKDSLDGFELIPIGKNIETVRSFKTELEIEYIKKAQSITDAAFSAVLGFIKVGVSERDIAVELEYQMSKRGAEGLAFDTIIASGVNSSKPHAHPTEKLIENGDPVTMDFGARYHGYCSDMTRTVFVGEPKDELRKIYNVVSLAQNMGITSAYPGMTGKELDTACREIIKANGFGEYFTHSTGHSLGIDIHETPYASARSQDTLQTGQLITCEPGIYVPGVGGVRIEDMLLFEEDSVIDLTMSDKNIIIL